MTERDLWDEAVAFAYDADDAVMFSSEVLGPTVAFLVHLAAGRPVLEFAAGTGRVALETGQFGAGGAVPFVRESSAPVVRLARSGMGVP